MKSTPKFLILSAALLLSAAGGLVAQSTNDAWLAGLITGGNVTSSSANTLGGLGHFSFGIHGTISTDPYKNFDLSSGSVAGVLRLGILEGSRLGPTLHGILSLDAFARVGQLRVSGGESDGAGFWGLGGRLGILRNSILMPAVSVSLARHKTGELVLSDRIVGPLNPAHKKLSVTSFRLDVSKNLFTITPYGGLGVNRVEVDNKTFVNSDLDKTESVIYGGIEWNILVLRLGMELMRTAGETMGTAGLRLTF